MKNLFLTKTRWLVTIILLTALGIGNAWGQVASATATSNGEYVVAVYNNSKYYALPNISSSASASTFGGVEVSVNNSGEVTTENPPLWKLTVNPSDNAQFYISYTSGGTEYYLYKNGTTSTTNYNIKVVSSGQHYWTFTAGTSSNAGKYQVISKRGSANTALAYTNSKWKVSGKSGYNIILLPVAEDCSNKVTISKGSETNGTFELNKTGEQNACDALSVTITPSPAEHFHVASVSATDPATTGKAGEAVDNGDGTWTITYSANSKGASTVNVTFEEDTKHTLTFYNNGAQVEQIQVYDGEKIGASLPSLTSNEACHATSQTFAGWTTENIGSTPVHTVDVGKIVDYWTKPTGDMTIYAIWATIPASATTTFAAADYSTETAPITKEKDNITLYFDAGSIYKSNTPYTFTITSGNHYFSITASNKVLAKLETTCNSGTYCLYSVSDGTLSPNSSTASQTVTGINTYNVECYPKTNNQIRMQTCAVYCYDNYITSCQACVAPTSVTITGTNMYLGGQTISLTAAPEGGTGTPSYQWQKKISEVWTNLENDGSISGVTSNNLKISSCSYVNSGGYRCIVSTGDGCETKSHADGTDGYGVHVFSIHGKYTTDADYADAEIIWTSETTGTATIHLNAKKTYLFKVWSNNGYYYGHGAKANEDFMFQPTTWDCGTDNREMRLFTTVEGDYTFTVNIEHGLDGSPYVNLQVGYPSMTHPNTGYVYVQKFSWTPRLHYWYNDANKLTEWNDDPSLASDQYVNICGTDYWCVPVIDYYCNFIAADHNGQTTGDQHTNSPHPGQRLYNDGSWKWGEFSTYTIAYAGGDGSTGGPMASHTGLCPGSSQQLTANAFSKAYHTFNGWSDGNGHTYADQAMIENIQSNINLTAQWTKTPVEELLLNYSELNKYVGDPAVTLEVTGVTPEGADASVTWSSSNSSVASVVAATGVVTFGTVGTATITATSTVTGTTTAYCHVTVRNKPTATFVDLIHDGNGTDLSTYNMQNVAGTAIVFPTLDDYATPGDDCDTKHYVFVGWTTSDNNDDPQDHLVASGELEDGQDKVFYAVWADGVEGVSYTKLTTNSFKTSPTKYVIGAEYNGDTYYFYNCAATDANNGNGSCTTSPATNAPIQFTLSGTADALVATSTEAPARYLTPLTGNNFQMSATTKTIALSENGDILNASTTTWALRFNTSNKYLRWYNTAPGSAAYFYEVTAGAAVNYRTSCCTNNVPAPTVIATNTAYTVTLTWAAVDGATGYEVSWNGGAFEAATSPCVKSGLTASMDYIYKVRATYDPLVKCGALVASGNVTTDDVYSVTYSGGTGTGSCSPSGSVAPVSYEAGATVTLAPTNSFSMTSNRFAAWVVKDADDNVIPVSNNQFTMPAKNVTVTATWTAVQDKYYDRMHHGTDALHGGIADGEGKYYLVLEGCNYTVPALTDDAEGDTDCHTTHFKLLGWIAQSHLKADGQIIPGEERFIFQGGGTKSATGATYYAIWAIMTE